MHLKEINPVHTIPRDGVDWTDFTQTRDQWHVFVKIAMKLQVL
jgi:hypothetical protein